MPSLEELKNISNKNEVKSPGQEQYRLPMDDRSGLGFSTWNKHRLPEEIDPTDSDTIAEYVQKLYSS